jgi:glycosyltransferase involved in cell wall biosynthesis
MQTEQPKKANESPLQSGNTALRQGDKAGAIRHYVQALVDSPGLHRIISANLVMARQKYRAERNNASKPRVGVCGWELAHNAAGRVYTLAMLYETFADVEIIGSLFPSHGREVWEPIRSTPIAKHSFVVEDEARFMDQAIQLVAAHPYDIVHLSKPRAPNIFFGILYKLIWDARVLMDIDDEELAFVDAETPISADDYIRQHGKLPDLKHLAGKDWTRLAVGMVNGFDGITVCNTALQQRYGGEIIRHARDEKLFNPSPELTRKCREKFGIPQDKKVVLFFGTPREHKGLIETARAIAELKKPEVLFCIAGDFPDTALKKKLQEIKGCQIAFLPNQPFKAIPQVVSIADCCVLMHDEQSLAGRFQTPAKLSDALAMGLQVLTNSTAALTGLNEPDAVTVVSHGTLCAALQKVLFNQPLSPKLQSKARQLFEAELTIGVNAPRLKKIATTGQVTVFRDSEYLKLIPLPMGVLRNGATPSRSGMHDAPAKEEVRSLDVDVVVPVYNALDDVRRCLESLSRHTDGLQVRIIVVNDGSEQPTTDWLRTFCTGRPGLHLIENPVNLGYTKTVNTGLRFSNAPYVITQNSDTIVSEGWLKGLIRCMESERDNWHCRARCPTQPVGKMCPTFG